MSTTVFTVFHWDFRPSTITVKPRALHFSLAQTKRGSVLPTAHVHPIIYIHSFLFEHHLGSQLTKLLLPRLLYVFFTSTNGNKNKAWDYFLFVLYAFHTFPASGIFLLLFQVHLYTSLPAINNLQELKQLIQRVLEETKRELKRPDMENGTESPVELPRITAVRSCWGRSKRTSWKIVTLNKLESSFKLDFYTRATGFKSSSSSLTSQNPNMSKSIKSEIQQSLGDTTALGHTPDCPQSCLCVYLGMLSR